MEENRASGIEELLGVDLPSEYVRFIQNSSDAGSLAARFEFEGGETCVDSFFSFSADSGDFNSILFYFNARIPGLPEKVIPIARDPGDWLICLDMRNLSGAVVVFDPDSGRIYSVVESFGKFLSILILED